jgi:hypothetical protein
MTDIIERMGRWSVGTDSIASSDLAQSHARLIPVREPNLQRPLVKGCNAQDIGDRALSLAQAYPGARIIVSVNKDHASGF